MYYTGVHRSCKCHLPIVFYILLHTSEGKMNTLTTFNKSRKVTPGPHTIKLNGKNDLAIFMADACSLCSYSHSWPQPILSMVTNRKGNCSQSRYPSNKDKWYKCLILTLPSHLTGKNAFKDETP